MRGAAEVLWTDSSGQAGLIFSRLAGQARQNIVSWLSSQQGPQKTGRVRGKRHLALAAGSL